MTGCHLYQLQEQLDGLDLDPVAGAEATNTHARMIAESAVCFDCGPMDVVCSLRPIMDLVKLPFPSCWFETVYDSASHLGVIRFGYLAYQTAEGISCYLFTKKTGATWQCPAHFKVAASGITAIGGAGELGISFANSTAGPLLVILSVLNCKNVRTIKQPAPAALNKKRSTKANRRPLHSFWVLVLDGSNESARNGIAGGTHASPRVHLRRGHFREFQPDKWCWVQPAVVGNRVLGVVEKEYRVCGHGRPSGANANG